MQQLLGGKVPWLVEKDVSCLRGLLDVGRQAVKVFDGGRVDLVHDVVVKDQPETVRLHNWDIVTPAKNNWNIVTPGKEHKHKDWQVNHNTIDNRGEAIIA